MTLSGANLGSVVICLTIVGYPLIAGLSEILNLPNTQLSIAMRAVVAIVASALVLNRVIKSKGRQKLQPIALALLFVLFLYAARLLEQSLLRPETLRDPASVYWIWLVGVTLLPTFSIAFSPSFNWARIEFLSLAGLTVAGVIVLAQASGVNSSVGIFDGMDRASLESLNPISVGNIGVGLVLLSSWWLATKYSGRLVGGLLLGSIVILGLYLVQISASRGPTVALGFSLVILGAAMQGYRRIWLLFGFTAMFVIVVMISERTQISDRFLFLDRFLALMGDSGLDRSSSIRVDLFTTTAQQILENPFSGSTIENSVYRWSPHNIFLEIALAAGLLVGLFFVWVMINLAVRAVMLIRQRHPAGGFALLFLASLVGAQFSGNVYQNATLWLTAMLVAVTSVRGSRVFGVEYVRSLAHSA